MVLTTGPRWGTVVTRPSASSSRSASRIDGRLTPVISQSSRSIRRWPGFKVPDMIASRNFCVTIERTVGTSSIRSVDGNSARLSIVYRLRCNDSAGIAAADRYRHRFSSDYRQNHHLRNLNMGRLVQRKLIVSAHAADQPPSIGMVAPVMSCAAGLHRKAAVAPTFSIATKRRLGWREA